MALLFLRKYKNRADDIAQYLAGITILVKCQMNTKVILLNNNELGEISKEQRSGYFKVWKTNPLIPILLTLPALAAH